MSGDDDPAADPVGTVRVLVGPDGATPMQDADWPRVMKSDDGDARSRWLVVTGANHVTGLEWADHEVTGWPRQSLAALARVLKHRSTEWSLADTVRDAVADALADVRTREGDCGATVPIADDLPDHMTRTLRTIGACVLSPGHRSDMHEAVDGTRWTVAEDGRLSTVDGSKAPPRAWVEGTHP